MTGYTKTQFASLALVLGKMESDISDDMLAALRQSGDKRYIDLAGEVHDRGDESVADELIAAACNRGLNACSLRPRGVIGAGDRNILPRMMRAAESGFMPVVRGGTPLLDLTVIDNLVDATITALDRGPKLRGEIFNISNGEPMGVRDIAGTLFKALGRDVKFVGMPWPVVRVAARILENWYQTFKQGEEPPLSVYSAGLTAFSQTLDISKARQLLDYKPSLTLEQGIHDFVNSIK